MKKCILFFPLLALALQPALVQEEPVAGDDLTAYSKNRAFHAAFTYGEGNSEFIPIADFTLFDAAGAIVYEKSGFNHTLFDIGDNGAVVGIDYDGPVSGKGTLHFYDNHGVEQGTASIGFLMARSFSEDGMVYCVHDGLSGVRVFDQTGRDLYHLPVAHSCALSPGGDLIALATDDRIAIHERGQEIASIPIGSAFIRQMVFSTDGSLFAFVDRKRLVVYDLPGKRIRFEREEMIPELEYVSVSIADDNSLVLVGEDEDLGRGAADRHARGLVSLLDPDGGLQWQSAVPYRNWNAFVPNVAFTGGKTFTVTTVEAVYKYQF